MRDVAFALGCGVGVQHGLSNGELPWNDDYLDTTDIPDIAARVLRNLQICHERAQDEVERYRAARMAAKLFPERPVFQALHAQAAEALDSLVRFRANTTRMKQLQTAVSKGGQPEIRACLQHDCPQVVTERLRWLDWIEPL